MIRKHPARTGTRTALITGASSGFGLITAVTLARSGFQVVATMRDLRKKDKLLEQAKLSGVESLIVCKELDVTSHEAAAPCMNAIIREYGPLDVVVNNAGFAVGGFIEDIPMQAWRSQMETNFFGLVAVTQAVLPSLRERGQGLIINISSISGRIGFPGYAPYAASKFAVEGFSEALRLEMLPYGVKVVLVEPGAYQTDIWRKGFEQIHAKPDSPYLSRLEAILRYSRHTAASAPDPQEVASLIARIADMRHPKLRYPLGQGTAFSIWSKSVLPWKWFERIINGMLNRK